MNQEKETWGKRVMGHGWYNGGRNTGYNKVKNKYINSNKQREENLHTYLLRSYKKESHSSFSSPYSKYHL